MSQETLQPAPVNPAGLSPELEQTAVALRQNESEKAVELEQHKARADRYETFYTHRASEHTPTMTTSTFNAIGTRVKQHKLNKAERAAKKHFEEHEDAYIEQAQIEMQSDPRNLGR